MEAGNLRKQYVIGHRGCRGIAPENSIVAFEKAIKYGAEIECDANLTRDKEIVVIHDSNLQRLTGVKGWVNDYYRDDLLKLHAGGEKIPELGEVVDLAMHYDKKLIIELKGKTKVEVCELAKKVTDFIKINNLINHVMVHSFWSKPLKIVKEALPDITTALIIESGIEEEELVRLALNAKANILSTAYEYISEDLISIANEKALTVYSWTINDEEYFERAKSLGVTGIITDYPNKFKITP